jgi:hypothetical protein
MYFLDKNTDFSSAKIFCLLSYSRTIVIDGPKSHPFGFNEKNLPVITAKRRHDSESKSLCC